MTKARIDFVTNSSSSSFIVSGEPVDRLQMQVLIDVAPNQIIETPEQLNGYVCERYDLRRYDDETDEEYEERWSENAPCWYDNANEAISRGQKIFVVIASNCGDYERMSLYYANSQDVNVINGKILDKEWC